jgi:type III restriction enzyme
MAGLHFEKNLPHQVAGVNAILNVFNNVNVELPKDATAKLLSNPKLSLVRSQYKNNIEQTQRANKIVHKQENYNLGSNVLDISMETGTGKTFTYANTMFSLNAAYGLNKFIVVVPTLSIKAGTVSFLKSEGLKEAFKETQREIKTYIVESQAKQKKGSKAYMPQAIHDFVNASNFNKKYIHVLVINAGMLNSDTLVKRFDSALFNEQYDTPLDALKAVNPFVIVDEPHKFPTEKKTWANIEKLNAQYIIRYGATFNDKYENLLYHLSAVDAFNDDLVKGINVYVETVQGNDNASIKLLSTDDTEAIFELNENNTKQCFSLTKGESLSKIHHAIHDLFLDGLTKSKVALSNGIELTKTSDPLNPYSYAQSLQDQMMQKAIKEHFKLERHLLTQSPRIKPLTLFFIDDIKGYREGNELAGSLKSNFEQWIKSEATRLYKTETNEFYKAYLKKTLDDISVVHGGYFSKDNTGKDDKIEQEINEILHDKELLLSLDNPRRFIFSKWTLREGWDNPNVFQICKLRSSGSSTSKLQEVGRGLRLPVNEYMSRVKDQQFALNYFVDFTEADFVESILGEVNKSALEKEIIALSLTDELKDKIIAAYPELTKRAITRSLEDDNLIDDNDTFINDGYEKVKAKYPLAFTGGVKAGKVTKASDNKKFSKIRVAQYQELRELWELINHKAILEYHINNESEFASLFKNYILDEKKYFSKTGIQLTKKSLYINKEYERMEAQNVDDDDDTFIQISTMEYHEFIEQLASIAFIKRSTLHKVFVDIREHLDISDYLNVQTIRKIKQGFSEYLLLNAISKFEVSYSTISNSVHPTKFTNEQGQPLDEVLAHNLGTKFDEHLPDKKYLFEEVFFDSELEKENIIEQIEKVTVFSKIPKNSIKIPVAGGATYSPDFAYIVKTAKGEILNFIVETKDTESANNLRLQEDSKIKHAMKMFEKLGQTVNIKFETQFKHQKIKELIEKHIN